MAEPEESHSSKDDNGLELPLKTMRTFVSASVPGSQPDLEASALFAKAAELFLERLVHMSVAASSTMGLGAADAKRHALAYDDVATAVHGWTPCDFLQEVVPLRVTGAVAKQMRAALAAAPQAPGGDQAEAEPGTA